MTASIFGHGKIAISAENAIPCYDRLGTDQAIEDSGYVTKGARLFYSLVNPKLLTKSKAVCGHWRLLRSFIYNYLPTVMKSRKFKMAMFNSLVNEGQWRARIESYGQHRRPVAGSNLTRCMG